MGLMLRDQCSLFVGTPFMKTDMCLIIQASEDLLQPANDSLSRSESGRPTASTQLYTHLPNEIEVSLLCLEM